MFRGKRSAVGMFVLFLACSLCFLGRWQNVSASTEKISYVGDQVPAESWASGSSDAQSMDDQDWNNATKQFELGQSSFYGSGIVQRNLSQAFIHYNRSAWLDGNGPAHYMCGLFYSMGLLRELTGRNQAKAMVHYAFGAIVKDSSSQMALGYRYLAGIGCSRSCDTAIQYYNDAAREAIEPYLVGPPPRLQPPSYKIRLSDDVGGIYGSGASGSGAADPDSTGIGAISQEDIIQFYQYNTERNDATAQFVLGQLYYVGTPTVDRNFDRAFKLLKAAANQLPVGSNMKRDLNSQWLQASAQAASMLGLMYWRGDGVQRDNSTALKWFHRAAENGNPGGFTNLGLMYMHGIVVPKNSEKAFQYFSKAAEKDDAEAQVQLGIMAINRQPSDYVLAHKQFSSAARSGHPLALLNLGTIYRYGYGVQRNCMLAVTLFKSAAERGDRAKSILTESYNAFKKDKDLEKSLLLYIIAADFGIEIAQSNVAWILESGKYKFPSEDENNYYKALYWNRAANQGNVDARVKMGDYFYYGTGVTANPKKAVDYYHSAEVDQSALAMYNLGYMHENGIGVAQDYHLAKRMYDRALVTNPEAYLPINLALFKLNFKYFFHWLSHGGSMWLDAPPSSMSDSGQQSLKEDDISTEERVISEILKKETIDANSQNTRKGADEISSEDKDETESYHHQTDTDDFWGDEFGNGEDEDSEFTLILILIIAGIFLAWARQQQQLPAGPRIVIQQQRIIARQQPGAEQQIPQIQPQANDGQVGQQESQRQETQQQDTNENNQNDA